MAQDQIPPWTRRGTVEEMEAKQAPLPSACCAALPLTALLPDGKAHEVCPENWGADGQADRLHLYF